MTEKWTPELLFVHFTKMLAEADKRLTLTSDAAKEAVGAALVGQEKATSAALASADKAATLFAEATKDHFILSNGLQMRMDQQARDLISRNEVITEIKSVRSELTAALKAVDDKVDAVTRRVDTAEPLHALKARVDTGEGRTSGLDKASAHMWTIVMAIIAAAAVVVAITVALTR
jgi:septal ring factor EnvC (AmiA/AmiB activator)